MTAPPTQPTVRGDPRTPLGAGGTGRQDVPIGAPRCGAPDTDVDAACMTHWEVRAVWTADCSATVDLSRLAGPRNVTRQLPDRLARRACATRPGDLGLVDCTLALPERCLAVGTQYDIYRWVNLVNLWPLLTVQAGLKAERAGAILARSSRADRS